MKKLYSYSRKEKLKSRKELHKLFLQGKSVVQYPVRAFFCIDKVREEDTIDVFLQASVGTSKKYFKKAVERNHVKRWLREAYRTQNTSLKHYLQAEKKYSVKIFFLYASSKQCSFDELKEKMARLIHIITQKVKHITDA